MNKLRYIFLDVDGTLTDGGVYYDDTGNEIKKFCTKDGTGIQLAKMAGIVPVVLTGRECKATSRRMNELGVSHIYQNVKDKKEFLQEWITEHKVCSSDIGYIGDDVNDIASMRLCGFVACPSDAVDDVKDIADYISNINGGYGVVRDVVKYILMNPGSWNEVLNSTYNCGI